MSDFISITKDRLLVLRREDILGMRENPNDDPPCVQVFFRFSSFRGSTSNPAFITVTPEEGKEIHNLLEGGE